MDLITVKEAAFCWGVTPRRVQGLAPMCIIPFTVDRDHAGPS